jgi:NitT/TauT family transport system ATP-binding protein
MAIGTDRELAVDAAAGWAADREEGVMASRADLAEIVCVEGVSKTYGSAAAGVTALREVNLRIGEGEFVSLVGPSGCGKSTLMRIVADLLKPTAGSVAIRGRSPREARLQRQIGMVFQSPVLYDWRSVRRNVELPLEIIGTARGERRSRAEEMLRLVGLDDFHDRYPWQLSGGMQQRVSIARALAFEPVILLMDEPFGALDEIGRERMNQELQHIWSATGKTILFVTHSIPEAVFLSTRVIVMSAHPGRVVAEIDIDLPRPRTEETRTDSRFYELTADVRKALAH